MVHGTDYFFKVDSILDNMKMVNLMKKTKLLFILISFFVLFSVSFESVKGFDLEACHTKCDSYYDVGDYAGYGACTIECDNLAKAEMETAKETITKETVVEVAEEITEESVLEKEVECKSIGGGLKSCSLKEYQSFSISEGAKLVEKDGELIITSPKDEKATLTYNDGSQVTISEGEKFVPIKTSEIRERSQGGIGSKLKFLWKDLKSSNNKFKTFIDWFKKDRFSGTEKASTGIRA